MTQSAGRSVVDEGPAPVLQEDVVEGRADDDVGVAVAVDVPRRRHGITERGARLVALGGPGRAAAQPAGRAEIDIGPALVHLAVVEKGRADDDVGVAVAVDIPRRRRRVAE